MVPSENAAEAALVENATIYPAASLLDVCAHFSGQQQLVRHKGEAGYAPLEHPDMLDVRAQAHLKRALEVAADP